MGISTHVLDTESGLPAAGVPVALFRLEPEGWTQVERAATDSDGRVKHLLPPERALAPGTFRIRFDTGSYYAARGVSGLYPFVEIAFVVVDATRHFHIPLLLSANGYTTYRGS